MENPAQVIAFIHFENSRNVDLVPRWFLVAQTFGTIGTERSFGTTGTPNIVKSSRSPGPLIVLASSLNFSSTKRFYDTYGRVEVSAQRWSVHTSARFGR